MTKLIASVSLLLCIHFSYAQSDAVVDSLFAELEKVEGDEKIGIMKHIFFKQFYSAPQQAKQTAYQMWEIAKDSENKQIKGGAANNLAIMYALLLQQHDSAMYWANQSIYWNKQIGDSVAISKTLHNIGVSHWMHHRYDSGLYYYLQSVKIVEKLDLPEELVSSYANIGMVYQQLESHKKGLEYYHKALHLASKYSLKEFVMQIQVNISKAHKQIAQLDSAVWYTQKALQLAKETGSSAGLHHIYVTLADYHYTIKNYEKGLEYIKKVAAIPTELKDPTYGTEAEYVEAKLLMALNRYAEAKEVALKGINITQKNHRERENYLLLFYQLMPIIYANLKDFEKVIHYTNLLIATNNLTNKRTILAKTAELQTQYETEKKEQQIRQLEQAKKIEELEVASLQKQRLILGLSLLVPISLLIGGGWYVNRRRLHLQLEAEQKERAKQLSELKALRSQMNPHFVFNALNSIQDFILLNETKNARHYLKQFATLMRGFLDSSKKEFISLEEELPLLKSYIELEGLRLGKEFSYEIIFDEKINKDKLDEIEVPPLLIQPYVENAFKHGFLHKTGEKKLVLAFNKIQKDENNFLQLKIIDNGVGRKKSAEINARKQKTHQSFATQATAERLELLKNQSFSNATIEIKINDLEDAQGNPKGTEVIILIPISND